MKALAGFPCPQCSKPLDRLGECWKCMTRWCRECGRGTGSPFFALCWPCEHAATQAEAAAATAAPPATSKIVEKYSRSETELPPVRKSQPGRRSKSSPTPALFRED